MQEQFLDQRKALMSHILKRAAARGEIEASAITEDLWDVLPGYLIYRWVSPAGPLPAAASETSSTTCSFPASLVTICSSRTPSHYTLYGPVPPSTVNLLV